ncbi:hypothetical protein, partial [Celeribacter persicus]|uniref:hypothetical protein n=1 Tax=Celeribacter persicus TaxID=1651082 RepID=UPI001B85D629
ICRVSIMLSSGLQAVVLVIHFQVSALDNHDASALNRRRTSPMNSPSNSPLGCHADLLTPVSSALYAGRDGRDWVEIAGG